MAASPYISEVSRTDFAARVIDKSHEMPVLVDFWAPWCGPCRTLAPTLERLAGHYAGKLLVAKVNTDVEQELALEYRIRGIPAIKLFRNGKVAGEVVGVQPESALRALIDPFVPREIDALIEQAASLGQNGQAEQAVTLLRDILAKEPNNDRAKLALVAALSDCGGVERLDECQRLLDSLSLRAASEPDVERMRIRLNLQRVAADAPPREELERAVAADPDDLRARHRLAARLALIGNYEPALEHLLEIVRRDRKYEDDAGRKDLVGLFQLLGQQHPLVVKYRASLSRLLS